MAPLTGALREKEILQAVVIADDEYEYDYPITQNKPKVLLLFFG